MPSLKDQIEYELERRSCCIRRVDIYRSYSPYQRQMILISGAMVAMLTPFCDTVYLPALQDVTTSLNTTDVLTSITVSAYLGAVGIGQLLWGPLSDYYGRNPVLYGCLFTFEAFTIGCIFANSIASLIILRTIEGFIVGCCITSVQAVISDVFAPEVRGAALSYFLGPMLIGPIIAPLVGGILAEEFSWRADFVLLAVMALPITLFTFIFTPETHHWYVVKHRSAQILQSASEFKSSKSSGIGSPDKATSSLTEASYSGNNSDSAVKELEDESAILAIESGEIKKIDNSDFIPNESSLVREINRDDGSPSDMNSVDERGLQGDTMGSDINTPVMMMPWTVAAFLFDIELAAYYATVGLTFAGMFTSLTLLPIFLAKPPYGLPPGIVGVTFLPIGVAMLLGALAGGALSDWSGATYSRSPHGIMIFTLLISCLSTLGTVGFGFTLHNGMPLSAVLITQSVLGFGQAVIMPSTLSFLSSVRPDRAGAAGSTMMFLCFILAAVSISISTIVADLIGVGYYFLALGAFSAASSVIALCVCMRELQVSECRTI